MLFKEKIQFSADYFSSHCALFFFLLTFGESKRLQLCAQITTIFISGSGGGEGKVGNFMKKSHLLPFPQALAKRRGKSLSALNVK